MKILANIFAVLLFVTCNANASIIEYAQRDTNSLIIGTFSLDNVTQGIVQSNLSWNPSWLINGVLPVTSFNIPNVETTDTFYNLSDKNNPWLHIDISFQPTLVYTNPSIYFWTNFNFSAYDSNGVKSYGGRGNDVSWFDIVVANSIPSPVPEPSSSAMLLAGLVMLGFMVRLRKSR